MEPSGWIGQKHKLKHLMRSVHTGRIVHALLLTGPEGTGKRAAAEYLARGLVCAEADPPCGGCPACKQALAGIHPDIHVLEPERGMIRIDPVRALMNALSMRPYSAKLHIAIIDGADHMNESAQNALLKTLESPTGSVMFLLIAESASGLLPTVISRCQTLRFAPMSVQECAQTLMAQGIAPERARTLAGLAQGAPHKALRLNDDTEFAALRETVLRSIETLKSDKDVLTSANLLTQDKADPMRILDMLELWARDLMALQNGAPPFEADDVAKLQRCGIHGKRMLDAVLLARRQINANVAWTYVLENLYFSLLSHPKSTR